MSNRVPFIGSIDLTSEEQNLLDRVTLRLVDTDAHEAYSENAKVIPPLMDSLFSRDAIPKHRLEYFDDPRYQSGRIKGSYRNLFERNRAAGVEIYKHPDFLEYLRYFLFGADLPSDVVDEFKSIVGHLSPITPGDVEALCSHAKALANKYRLNPHDVAEEFFKLCLDCGVPLMHATAVRYAVRQMRLRKER